LPLHTIYLHVPLTAPQTNTSCSDLLSPPSRTAARSTLSQIRLQVPLNTKNPSPTPELRSNTALNMSVVSLLGVEVKNNPAPFDAPYEFEITFECLEQLQKGTTTHTASSNTR
jgi:hypothetical protein